ncbi:MAG: type IX secretion system outer membrane channel protein PorV, partial [Lentimicrobium sp.]|nr:type IX secretion system outer membrane channel protein PorV [Lentimicrobium sp.]
MKQLSVAYRPVLRLLAIVTFILFQKVPGISQNNSYPKGNLNKENLNVIQTAVPFLLIAPDPIGGAMGETGVARKADVFSMHWNPAKYAFLHGDSIPKILTESDSTVYPKSKTKVGLSYVPYMTSITGSNMAYFVLSQKIKSSVLSLAVRYFRQGEIIMTDIQGQELGSFIPKEYAIDLSYAKKINLNLSFALTGRFIHSNLSNNYVGGNKLKPANSFAADFGLYWQKKVDWLPDKKTELAWGLNISNVGSKMSYLSSNNQGAFLPTNLRLGPRLTIEVDSLKYLTLTIEISKLLVPTPPIFKRDSLGNPIPIPGTNRYEIASGMDNNVSTFRGLFQSFYDAPDGLSEELSEIILAFGFEFVTQKAFILRGGYHMESERKGNRKFFT